MRRYKSTIALVTKVTKPHWNHPTWISFSPMTSLEMNGHARFVFDWSDGRVMSERAYKMVKEDEAMAIREVSSNGLTWTAQIRLHETHLHSKFSLRRD